MFMRYLWAPVAAVVGAVAAFGTLILCYLLARLALRGITSADDRVKVLTALAQLKQFRPGDDAPRPTIDAAPAPTTRDTPFPDP